MLSDKHKSEDKFVKQHQPCPMCTSSDAFAIRADGTGLCFSCGKAYFPTTKTITKETTFMNYQAIPQEVRGIAPSVLKAYGVKYAIDGDARSYAFFRPNGQVLHRHTEEKQFWFCGEAGEGLALFGSDKFQPGSARAITITEGYFDALATFQMMGSKYPVVAVQSAQSAKGEAAQAYEYLNSFEKIYLCFDADEPGQEAAAKVARLFDFNKIYVVKLDKKLKDANQYLIEKQGDAFVKAWWAARRFLPEGILSSFVEFDKVIDEDIAKPSVPYPFQAVQEKTYGIRNGEMVLVTAQEGLGKTEFFRAIEHHLLKTTEDNIGIIHLEESKARVLKGLVNYEIGKPVHLPDFAVSKEDLKKHLRTAAGRDDRVHIYSHFGSDDPDTILSTVRFMAGACGCKYIFLDHITMVVSGLQGDDERRALDYISTRLAMMVEELDFTLFLISHVNDDGKTRGSRNISKVADLRIDLARNLQAESEELRNTTFLTISKNRYAGKTGPAGELFFDSETYLLKEKEKEILV